MYRGYILKFLSNQASSRLIPRKPNVSEIYSQYVIKKPERYCSSFFNPGSSVNDDKTDNFKSKNSSDLTSVLETKKNVFVSASSFDEELSSEHNLLDKNSLSAFDNDLLYKNEPELRVDIFEDTIKDSFGEVIPMFISKEEQSMDETAEPLLPSEQQEVSIKLLHRQIKTAQNYDEALNVFAMNKNNFFIEHYDSLIRVFTIFLTNRSCSPENLTSNREFLRLAKQICKLSRKFDTYELVTLVKFLALLNSPPSSMISTTVFQMVRDQINEFSVRQQVYMYNLIRKSDSNLQNAVKNAIPVLLDITLKSKDQLVELSPSELIMGLKIAIDNVSVQTAEKFLMGLFENENGLKNVNTFRLVSAITSLLELNKFWRRSYNYSRRTKTSHKQMKVMRDVLLKEGLQLSAEMIKDIPCKTAMFLLSQLCYAYTDGDSCAYNQNFLDECSKKFIKEEDKVSSLSRLVFVMRKMNRIDDYLIETILEKIEALPDLGGEKLFALALLNTIPSCHVSTTWDKERLHMVVDKLLHHESIYDTNYENSVSNPISRIGTDLACLDYFKPDIIKKILEQITAKLRLIADRSESNKSNLRGMEKVDFLQYLQFWQALNLLDNDNPTPEVNEELLSLSKEIVIDNGRHAASDKNNSLIKALLQDVFQGMENCLVTGLYTPNYVPIDYALVLGPDGKLVPQTEVNEGGVCTSQLNVPKHSKIIGIIEVDSDASFNNGQKPRSRLMLRMKVLAAENITTIPLLLPHLGEKETDKEKFQYVTAALHQHGIYV